MAKEAYYFSHDSNARNDPKILEIRAELGWEGYGLYFALLELMREQEDYRLNISDDKKLKAFALHLNCNCDTLDKLIQSCLEKDEDGKSLFFIEDGKLASKSFLNRMKMKDKIRQKRAEAGRKGGSKKKDLEANAKQNGSNNEAKPKQVKEKKGKEIEKEKKGKVKGKTLPPSADDFTFNESTLKRISEKGLSEEDARKYLHECLDYYQGHGKMMKDWQATYRNWISKDWIKPSKTRQGFKTDWESVG